jgi:hypothetical protein
MFTRLDDVILQKAVLFCQRRENLKYDVFFHILSLLIYRMIQKERKNLGVHVQDDSGGKINNLGVHVQGDSGGKKKLGVHIQGVSGGKINNLGIHVQGDSGRRSIIWDVTVSVL